ncbi:MAG: hypothetical protein EPO37_01810, partial [Nitrosarchaeum sp.]
MTKAESDIKYKEVKIHIKNAPVTIAGGITHQLYEMVDLQEVHSVSIEDVRKSEHSVEVVIGVIIGFGANYLAEKVLDVPYNYTIKKIVSMLKKWKRNTPQKTLDIFM